MTHHFCNKFTFKKKYDSLRVKKLESWKQIKTSSNNSI